MTLRGVGGLGIAAVYERTLRRFAVLRKVQPAGGAAPTPSVHPVGMTELGEKIGESVTAEVFAFGAGRVIKLYRARTPLGILEYEVRATQAAYMSGAPAPEVLGTETVDGRAGIILQRYDGRSLIEMIMDGSISPAQAGVELARVHAGFHAGQYAADVWTFRQFVGFTCGQLSGRGIPGDVIDRSLTVSRGLPEVATLCHGDLHPGNILMTEEGPRIIDWTSAMLASPLADVARQHLTMAVFAAPAEYEGGRRALEASFMRTYAELTETTEGELRMAIAPYVTVMAVMRMSESGCGEDEQAMLIDFVRSR